MWGWFRGLGFRVWEFRGLGFLGSEVSELDVSEFGV